MNPRPVVVDQEARQWEAWPADQVVERGEAEWKTLISAGLTPSEGLTMGIGRLPKGGSLRSHRHEQAEAYLILDGVAVLTIDGTARTVGPGVAVFIPGNALHSVKATGESELRLAYVLAADSFDDVEYVFGDSEAGWSA
ncbi:MAG: cupin domain-containing protein [Solirubrobacteraceae bacterium]